MGTQKKERLHS